MKCGCNEAASGPAGLCSFHNWQSWASNCSSFDLLSDEFDPDQLNSDLECTRSERDFEAMSSTLDNCHQANNGGCDSPMEDLEEFIQGRGNVEAELNYLTLSDKDQRTLYESAKIIQSAFRQYKVKTSLFYTA